MKKPKKISKFININLIPTTSWDTVALWYDEMLKNKDTYQSSVILPNLLRLLPPEKHKRIIDIACGQGFFSRNYAEQNSKVLGIDISPELIKKAKQNESGNLKFKIGEAENLQNIESGSFDGAMIILALQNIKNISAVFKESYRVLDKGGKLVIVLNHPTFRILKSSSWGFDKDKNIQYRRVDKYGTAFEVKVDMNPSEIKKNKKIYTISFHRSLQEYFKAIVNTGFFVVGLEEWNSHKQSQKGPREKAENIARKEFPMFLTIVALKV